MTYDGGKPHIVGYQGQRYEVSIFDDNEKNRIVIGWTDDSEQARKMADSAELKPSWSFAWVTDLKEGK